MPRASAQIEEILNELEETRHSIHDLAEALKQVSSFSIHLVYRPHP